MNDEIECIFDKNGNKYYVLINSQVDKSKHNIGNGLAGIKDKFYYDGKLIHRENGPAVQETDGRNYWFKKGLNHREDGPAIEGLLNYKAWYKNGLLHREDGPAIQYPNGDKEYWVNGKKLSEEQFNLEKDLREILTNKEKKIKIKI